MKRCSLFIVMFYMMWGVADAGVNGGQVTGMIKKPLSYVATKTREVFAPVLEKHAGLKKMLITVAFPVVFCSSCMMGGFDAEQPQHETIERFFLPRNVYVAAEEVEYERAKQIDHYYTYGGEKIYMVWNEALSQGKESEQFDWRRDFRHADKYLQNLQDRLTPLTLARYGTSDDRAAVVTVFGTKHTARLRFGRGGDYASNDAHVDAHTLLKGFSFSKPIGSISEVLNRSELTFARGIDYVAVVPDSKHGHTLIRGDVEWHGHQHVNSILAKAYPIAEDKQIYDTRHGSRYPIYWGEGKMAYDEFTPYFIGMSLLPSYREVDANHIYGIRYWNRDFYRTHKDDLPASAYDRVLVTYYQENGSLSVGLAQLNYDDTGDAIGLVVDPLPLALKNGGDGGYQLQPLSLDKISGVLFTHHPDYGKKREVYLNQDDIYPLDQSWEGGDKVEIASKIRLLSSSTDLVFSDGNYLTSVRVDKDKTSFWALVNKKHFD